MDIQVFAEGNDIKFIKDYIAFLQLPRERLLADNTEGWTNLKKVKPRLDEASDKSFTNLVIFDANGNVDTRRQEILAEKDRLNVEFELFLFPDNQSNGMVETLLLSIIPDAQLPLLNCFDAYCNEIQQINPNIQFSLKSKFYAYLEATGQPNIKKVNFLDTNYWDLKSNSLQNLRDFLRSHIY